MIKKNLGGDRLGSGHKMEVEMHNYERSTHDLGYTWRSSMSAGTLVPFMAEIGLPGDSFEIDLDCDVKTHPTVGPLFGSYKVQLDVFECPIRLYNALLHNNELGIGMNMEKVLFPLITLNTSKYIDTEQEKDYEDNDQINASSILSYLNIRGLGTLSEFLDTGGQRDFNALSLLSYWDIYKNYYANKQEEKGAVIHFEAPSINKRIEDATIAIIGTPQVELPYDDVRRPDSEGWSWLNDEGNELVMRFNWMTPSLPLPDEAYNIVLWTSRGRMELMEYTNEITISSATLVATGTQADKRSVIIYGWTYRSALDEAITEPKVKLFPLENLDKTRKEILRANEEVPFMINSMEYSPWSDLLNEDEYNPTKRFTMAYEYGQEGLALKTYQSDLFNNWLSTEWIDGTDGITAITAIQVVNDEITVDAINLANKVYVMLNRIAISGGSFDDWLEAVYTHNRVFRHETPIYHGSLIKELAFQEVISNAEAGGEENQPLGTLAGRGVLTQKNKGGKIHIKVDEPCYILGIVSLTPRVDYSQGNKWDVNLKTLNDLHKPQLDEIGFQDLITDQMSWFDTTINDANEIIFKSAGKQPAWINYMTNVNQTRGSFAEQNNEMFMTLNRRYEYQNNMGIKDLTTYIDPVKFNYIFAQTSRDAQNFWTQIRVDNKARRKISAKVIPNL